MGTIHCPGGHTFSDGEVPSPYGYTLISEEKLDMAVDTIVERVAAGGDIGDNVDAFVRDYGQKAYICPKCGRIIAFYNGIDKPATSYRRE